jgi:hypothetical protein
MRLADRIWFRIRCLIGGHTPKFSTYPNCLYCGKPIKKWKTR